MNFTLQPVNDDGLASAARPNLLPQRITPSRHTNPFATCWTRPGALTFSFHDSQSANKLIAQLAAQDWNGEILGPHGSGKSTLLATLVPRIEATGRRITSFELRNGQRRLPAAFWRSVDGNSSSEILMIIDGYEQLGWFERLRLKRFCRRWRTGLLVTSHSRTGLPTLTELLPDLDQIVELANALCEGSSSTIDRREIAASHARHGSNVREIFFDLYDRHERARRRR